MGEGGKGEREWGRERGREERDGGMGVGRKKMTFICIPPSPSPSFYIPPPPRSALQPIFLAVFYLVAGGGVGIGGGGGEERGWGEVKKGKEKM